MITVNSVSPVHQEDNQLLFMEEVAAILRRPIKTLRHWRWQTVSRGIPTGPPSFKTEGRVAYWRDDVYAWLEQQRRQSDVA